MILMQALIFDLDGVIVDTAKFHYLAWKDMAADLDIMFSEEQNEDLKGVSRIDSLNYILDLGKLSKTSQEINTLAEAKNDHYLKLISNINRSEILPGVENLIITAREKGLKIALGSSSKNARVILEKLNLIQYFDAIVDGTKTTKGKPHPQVFNMGAQALKVDPAKTVVFEDAIKGVRAAKAGGFKCIGVGTWENLMQADYVIEGFADFKFSDLERIY